MNSRTKNILIFSLCIFGVSIVLLGFLLYQINSGGKQLSLYSTALNEKTAQENAYIKIQRLVEETESERTALASVFFADESDSITFLGEIEKFAKSVQIDLKTEGLDKKTSAENNTEYITMTFVYSGDKTRVDNFTSYIQTIPYHSKIESLSLERDSNGSWKGTLTLNITIKPS